MNAGIILETPQTGGLGYRFLVSRSIHADRDPRETLHKLSSAHSDQEIISVSRLVRESSASGVIGREATERLTLVSDGLSRLSGENRRTIQERLAHILASDAQRLVQDKSTWTEARSRSVISHVAMDDWLDELSSLLPSLPSGKSLPPDETILDTSTRIPAPKAKSARFWIVPMSAIALIAGLGMLAYHIISNLDNGSAPPMNGVSAEFDFLPEKMRPVDSAEKRVVAEHLDRCWREIDTLFTAYRVPMSAESVAAGLDQWIYDIHEQWEQVRSSKRIDERGDFIINMITGFPLSTISFRGGNGAISDVGKLITDLRDNASEVSTQFYEQRIVDSVNMFDDIFHAIYELLFWKETIPDEAHTSD